MRSRGGALLALLLLWTNAAVAGDPAPPPAAPAAVEDDAAPPQWGRGPFEVRDPFVTALGRLSAWARSPRTLAHGQVEVGLRGAWTNSYAFAQGRLVLDAEVREVDAVVRVGLLDRLELGLGLPYEWRGGGVLDGFIEGFHGTFGLPVQDRDERPRDRLLVTGLERDGTSYHLDGGEGLADLVPEARALLLAGDDRLPALALTLRLRLPSGHPGLGLGHGVDASLTLDASKRLGRLPLVAYLSLAYVHGAQGRLHHLEVRRHRAFVAVGLEWELTRRVSFVVHFWWESARERKLFADPATGVSPSPVPPADLTYGNLVTYVAGGFKVEPVDGLTVELGLLEDLVDPETTADLGLLGNVSWRF